MTELELLPAAAVGFICGLMTAEHLTVYSTIYYLFLISINVAIWIIIHLTIT